MAYRDTIEALLAQYDETLRDAFLAAIDDIRNGITLRVVVERLERNDIQGAIEAMGLDGVVFERLERAMVEAYNAGGTAEVGQIPRLINPDGARVVFRFGVRNTAGEVWLRGHSSQLVTRIIDDQREAIRTALSEGLAEGRNPRSTALEVVGRIDRATNRRVGGVIGLTEPQERYVAAARRELLSGDETQLRAFLGRARRDKRFDRLVLKAIRERKPIIAADVERMVGRYSDRLLQLRGEMLARTETMMALSKGRDDAIRQQIQAGKIEAQDVTKRWRSAADNRVRHTHRALNGQRVEIDRAFQSPSGALIRYPGDPQAPTHEIVGCRCFMSYVTDYGASVVRRFQVEAA